ncbi:MAG: hypothetical protein ACJA2P_000351 [Rhodoferax sp.]|jgi:hypothetical protein
MGPAGLWMLSVQGVLALNLSSLFFRARFGGFSLGVLLVLLPGCASSIKAIAPQEKFGSTSTYSRLFDATAAQACEAARRALLSQGYVISILQADMVVGKKNFQPELESHLQVEIRAVCVPESRDGKVSLSFVTALQDRYALKKSNNSASLGVGALGSVSLPFSSSNDSMVRVGSETITSEVFYERFFDLVKRYRVADEPFDEPLDESAGALQPPG